MRRRYVAAHDLLADYGRMPFYYTLLELLGCAHMSRARVEDHLKALIPVFDLAKEVITRPFPFAADLSESARPVAIDGSQELIDRGYHREAMFWIAVTYSRCQQVLYRDGSVEMQERCSPGYRRMLGDLGIDSVAALQQRCAEVKEFLPRLWAVAEAIIAANPQIDA